MSFANVPDFPDMPGLNNVAVNNIAINNDGLDDFDIGNIDFDNLNQFQLPEFNPTTMLPTVVDGNATPPHLSSSDIDIDPELSNASSIFGTPTKVRNEVIFEAEKPETPEDIEAAQYLKDALEAALDHLSKKGFSPRKQSYCVQELHGALKKGIRFVRKGVQKR